MTAEIELLELDDAVWSSLLDAAAELDLVHGGLYRSRPGEILFYASPGCAPAGWSGDFRSGTDGQPCELLGRAEVWERISDRKLLIRLQGSDWQAARRAGDDPLRQEAALRGDAELKRWLRKQWDRLREHAEGRLIGCSAEERQGPEK